MIESAKEIDGQLFTANEIIKKYENLVHFIANKYRKCTNAVISYEDLVNQGNLGLWKAYEGFDQTKGFVFMTYAHPKVHGEIQRIVRDHNPGPNFPRSIKVLSQKSWNITSANEIKEQLGITLEQAFAVTEYRERSKPIHLEFIITDSKWTIADILPDHEDFSQIYVDDFLKFLKSKNELLYNVAVLALQDHSQSAIGKSIGLSQVQAGRYIKTIRNLYKVFSENEVVA